MYTEKYIQKEGYYKQKRVKNSKQFIKQTFGQKAFTDLYNWDRQDSNLRRTNSTDLQSVAFNHSATLP